ncbi:MAG TPA: glycosyltransferase [Xanthomonadaceae bacterium]|jgi:glycosyltransferase involved in cell wall biosynthesis|nr:glycosyltransferase [Xanthomonadaceae bacterium]
MIHVLSIIHYPIFGGPHNRNARLAPIFAERGVKTTVLLPDEPGNAAQRLRDAGLDVVLLPLRRIRATRNISTHLQLMFGFPGQVRAVRKLMKDLRIDIVQINGLVNPHGAIAARALGIPVVWQVLDTYTPMSLRKLLAPVVRRYADVVMCTGQQVADAHPGVADRPDRLVNFYPPVDVQQFKCNPAMRQAARESLGLDESDFVVGTIGNINLQKGHDNFIRAAAALKSRVAHAKFVILGATHENHRAYIDGLWRLAAELGLELGRDLLSADPTGKVHEMAQAFDVFWMTPRPNSEGIPTAMEEAMALHLPVVSFDVGSIGELVEHGRTGYLVEDQDPLAIAERTFQNLLDSASRERMGEFGRLFIEANASLEKCADTHVRAYELAIQSGMVHRPGRVSRIA